MNKRKIVRKWMWVWDFEKEEQWLNEMAMEGWALEKVGFCTYKFIHCEPGEYIIRLEMHDSDDAYMDLMHQTGAEYIGRVCKWIYFRRKSEHGAFDIFSNIDSRISHLESIAKMLLIIGIANIIIGLCCYNNHLGFINLLCGCLLMYGLGRIRGKEDELKKERMLHE